MIRDAISRVVEGDGLTIDSAREVMSEMMDGKATQSQIGSFVTAMRMKGETQAELLGFVLAMRERSARIEAPPGSVDLCGTGGDRSGTFNISTTASFVVAAAGVPVAKHGNTSVSSGCGSADVLGALRIPVDLDAARVGRCISVCGLGFMFAPVFHDSMRNVAGPRRELGVRTFFNLLGPLTNPAGVKNQLIGVYDASVARAMAGVLRETGTSHAMIVNGCGLDELSTIGRSHVVEVVDGRIAEYDLDPGSLALASAGPEDLKGGEPAENARIAKAILKGELSARSDTVALNAAAALYVAGRAASVEEGLDLARTTLRGRKAFGKLQEFARTATSLDAERQMAMDPRLLEETRIQPDVLKARSGELATVLVSRILDLGGSSALASIDQALLSEPSVLSVIVLRRLVRLLTSGVGAGARACRPRTSLSRSLAPGRLSLIAEYKPSSPTSRPLEVAPEPAVAAKVYSNEGVVGISVLVEPDFFLGGSELFSFFRSRSAKPMLYKDFVVTERQLEHADRVGADAVLLIAKALAPAALESLTGSCISRGMEPLVEIHDEGDLAKLMACDCFGSIDLVGINSRDLRTLDADLGSIHRLRELVPEGKKLVAESGVRTPLDLRQLRGFDAVLIGSAFMQADDLGATVAGMVGASRSVGQ